MKHKNIGDSFDDFLKDEGLLDEVEHIAFKRVVAYQLREAMRKKNISRTSLAQKMNTSRSSVNRLLDPKNEAITFKTLKKAADALQKRVLVQLV
jgi:DNA-binding Xre family transcriptional regulator